jgi:hypothetical protein
VESLNVVGNKCSQRSNLNRCSCISNCLYPHAEKILLHVHEARNLLTEDEDHCGAGVWEPIMRVVRDWR